MKKNTVLFLAILLVLTLTIIIIYFLIRKPNTLSDSDSDSTNNLLDKNNSTKIICFSGGGLASVAFHSAVIGGVIFRLNEDNNKTQLNEYFNSYSVLSGNSGGGWAMSLMCYSKNFYDMINMGASGQDMFGLSECDNTKPLEVDYINSGLCLGDGITFCAHGDSDKCCCDIGYRPSMTDTRVCVNCQLNKQVLTMPVYFQRIIENATALLSGSPIDGFFDYILWNVLPSQLYAIPNLLGSEKSYQDLVNSVIIKPVGDLDTDITIDSNILNLNCSLKWSTGILRSGVTVGPDTSPIDYRISGPFNCSGENTLKNCGVSIPVNIGYDMAKKETTGPMYTGHKDRKTQITYRKKIDSKRYNDEVVTVDITDAINSDKISKLTIHGITTGTAAGIGFLTSEEQLENIYKQFGVNDTVSWFESTTCWWDSNPHCGFANYFTHKFQGIAPTMMLNNGGDVKIPCEKNEEDICKSTTATHGSDFKNLKGNIQNLLPVKMIDGAFHDDTGIISGLLEFQRKNPITPRCKILHLRTDAGVSKRVYNLFGKEGPDGTVCKDYTINKNGVVQDKIFFEYGRIESTIFESHDCDHSHEIFRGRYDKGSKWVDTHNCGDDHCSTTIKIQVIKDIKTVDNRNFGIKSGTDCDLFIVDIMSGEQVPVIVTPDMLHSNSDNIFTNLASTQSKLVYEIIKRIPSDVFGVVFGDDDYDQDLFPSTREKPYPNYAI